MRLGIKRTLDKEGVNRLRTEYENANKKKKRQILRSLCDMGFNASSISYISGISRKSAMGHIANLTRYDNAYNVLDISDTLLGIGTVDVKIPEYSEHEEEEFKLEDCLRGGVTDVEKELEPEIDIEEEIEKAIGKEIAIEKEKAVDKEIDIEEAFSVDECVDSDYSLEHELLLVRKRVDEDIHYIINALEFLVDDDVALELSAYDKAIEILRHKLEGEVDEGQIHEISLALYRAQNKRRAIKYLNTIKNNICRNFNNEGRRSLVASLKYIRELSPLVLHDDVIHRKYIESVQYNVDQKQREIIQGIVDGVAGIEFSA